MADKFSKSNISYYKINYFGAFLRENFKGILFSIDKKSHLKGLQTSVSN